MFSLEQLGYSPFFSAQIELIAQEELNVARISADGRDVFQLAGVESSLGELSGKLRQRVQTHHLDRPIVGDWVTVSQHGARAVIHHVLERRTLLLRRAAGSDAQAQAIAANVDRYFIVTAPGEDFSQRRLERYLTAVWNSGASPVLVLNKTDLAEASEPLAQRLAEVALAVPIVMVSAQTGAGLDTLLRHLERGLTAAFIGSSGVGKSSLLNRLLEHNHQPTSTLDATGRGRHTTTQRELVVLPNGAVVIDTPGLREMGLVEEGSGLDAAFADITALSEHCRYTDCTHASEPGCTVVQATLDGTLPAARLESYHRLRREVAATAARRDPAQIANSKKRWKSIHKQVRALGKTNPKFRKD